MNFSDCVFLTWSIPLESELTKCVQGGSVLSLQLNVNGIDSPNTLVINHSLISSLVMRAFSAGKAMDSMKFSKVVPTFGFVWLAMLPSLVSAQLTADFSLNTSSFFSSNATARAAAEAAIADLNAALNQNLGAVTAADQTVTGSFGADMVDISITASVTNPSTGSSVDVSVANAQSVVPIFVGARNLPGSAVGLGGPSSWGFSIPNTSIFNISDFGVAVTNAANATNLIYLRGEGPVVSRFNSSLGGFPFELTLGLGHGSVAIDSGFSNFHFDHTTPVPAGMIDLYSVVLHEAMHAIGLGPSPEWDMQVSGTNWTGSEVVDFLGSGSGVIAFGVLAPDENHVAEGVLSPTITDGRMQQSVLVPSIRAGFRFRLTELDLAFMRDLGYSNAVVPPRTSLLGDFDLDGDVDLADLDQYNSNIGSQAVGALNVIDLNGNFDVDTTDFETHYTTLVETSNGNTGTAAGDINLDGVVNVLGDAFALVSNLGNVSASSWSQGDLNADGAVDVLGDAFMLISNLGFSNN